MALQGAGLLKVSNVAPQATQVWDCLLISRQERRAWAGWVKIYERRVPIALQARVKVIVLGCTGVNSKPRSNDGLGVKDAGSPGKADARIEVGVVGVIQSRIGRTWRCVDRRGIGAVRRSWSQANAVKLGDIENRG